MINKKGFSLIEVIIVISLIAVIGVISSGILTRSYKTSSDSDLISKLKQNTGIAFANIEEEIRTADGIVCYGDDKKIIVLRNAAGRYVHFRFVDPIKVGEKVRDNGYIAKKDNLNPDDLPNFCIFPYTLTANEFPITDTNISTGVSVTDGMFTYHKGSEGKDAVTIDFNIRHTGLPDGSLEITNFKSTVQVR